MKISLRYNHACFVTTATTSLHIQPCLQHIQHPAQFFIVFLQLLACYSATLLLKHHCKRSLDFKHMQSACSHHQDFKTGASQCISFLAIAHLGNDPHYPALHARVEPCWENVSERNQTHFSGILFPLRFLLFTFISLLRLFFRGRQHAPAASACCWSDCNCSAGTDSDTWKTDRWFREEITDLLGFSPQSVGISLGQIKMPLDVRQPQVYFLKIQILKSFLFCLWR